MAGRWRAAALILGVSVPAGSTGPRASRRQGPARLPAPQRRRVGWPGSRVPGGSGAGEARGPGRRGAEQSRAEQPRPPPPGRALPSRDPRARAQRRASAAARGSRPCPRPSPGRRPRAPCALPPPAARCRWPSTLRPGVSAHSDGAAPACPRGLSPSWRACQARPRSCARYLGHFEMAWPRSARGAQTPHGWRESGPGVWCVPEVLSPRGPGEVVAGRAQSARALRTRGPRHPCEVHVHDTLAGGAEGSQTLKCPKFSSEHFAGLNFEM